MFVVLEAQPDDLTLGDGSPSPGVRVPMSTVASLHVRRGRSVDRMIAGGFLGALAGVVATALVASAADDLRQLEAVGTVFPYFLVGGSAFGVALGARERWEDVPLGAPARGVRP